MDHGADFEQHKEGQTCIRIAPNSGAKNRPEVSHRSNHAGSWPDWSPEYWRFTKQGKVCRCETNGLNAPPLYPGYWRFTRQEVTYGEQTPGLLHPSRQITDSKESINGNRIQICGLLTVTGINSAKEQIAWEESLIVQIVNCQKVVFNTRM
jgi:hypothetical protein